MKYKLYIQNCPHKKSCNLATAQKLSLKKIRKNSIISCPNPDKGTKRASKQTFKQKFHIKDIKQKNVETPFITKYNATINILNGKLHVKDKYTRTNTISLRFF